MGEHRVGVLSSESCVSGHLLNVSPTFALLLAQFCFPPTLLLLNATFSPLANESLPCILSDPYFDFLARSLLENGFNLNWVF